MPTYQYTCKQCGHEMEAAQKITADPLINCPQCHQDTLQRGVGGGLATLRFTGSGFYITDYGPSKQEGAPNESASPKPKSCGCGKNNCSK